MRGLLRAVVAIGIGFVGLIAIIGGSFALTVEQSIRTIDNAAEGRVPGTLEFDAEEATYGVVIFVAATDFDANDIGCEAVLANEKRVRFRGNVQKISVSAKSKSVGEFDAVQGRTRLTCEWAEGDSEFRSQRFAVAKIRTGVRTGAIVAIVGGTVILLGAIFWGVFGALRRPKGTGDFGGTSRPV